MPESPSQRRAALGLSRRLARMYEDQGQFAKAAAELNHVVSTLD